MIKINLLCVGNLKELYWKEAIAEYSKRISRYASFNIIEAPERRTVAEEGKEIMKRVKGYAVAFDLGGNNISSTEFAELFKKRLNDGDSEITLIIGGSEGLSAEVKNHCKTAVAFGKVTYPHQLMRVIAAEQIYRALTILNNVTYHK